MFFLIVSRCFAWCEIIKRWKCFREQREIKKRFNRNVRGNFTDNKENVHFWFSKDIVKLQIWLSFLFKQNKNQKQLVMDHLIFLPPHNIQMKVILAFSFVKKHKTCSINFSWGFFGSITYARGIKLARRSEIMLDGDDDALKSFRNVCWKGVEVAVWIIRRVKGLVHENFPRSTSRRFHLFST